MARYRSRRLPRTAPEGKELERELGGRRAADADAPFEVDAVDDLGELSDTDIYEGELEAGVDDDLDTNTESLELLTEQELRSGETDSAIEASDEAEVYVPPIDPPIVPDGDPRSGGAQVAAGIGTSALDEPFDEDHHREWYPGEDEIVARVRDALRADSSTTGYSDQVRIIARGTTVVLRGVVDDLDDTDNMVAVASYVNGVDEVIDELEVRNL